MRFLKLKDANRLKKTTCTKTSSKPAATTPTWKEGISALYERMCSTSRAREMGKHTTKSAFNWAAPGPPSSILLRPAACSQVFSGLNNCLDRATLDLPPTILLQNIKRCCLIQEDSTACTVSVVGVFECCLYAFNIFTLYGYSRCLTYLAVFYWYSYQ